MQQYCIKVKRKGFNYYTDYMERYFEKVAVEYGYHLTKRREQADLWCVTFISDPQIDNSKWITFTSSELEDIPYERLEELSRLVGLYFKSESVLETADDKLMELTRIAKEVLCGETNPKKYYEIKHKYGSPYLWFFSREYCAFDEPVYFAEGETIFKQFQHDLFCVSGKVYSVTALNVGGASKGLTVDISFRNIGEVKIEGAIWTVLNNRHSPKQYPFEFVRMDTNDRIVFHAELSNFNIHSGFNEYSAKLCGKPKAEAAERCAVHFLFTPYGSEAILSSMEVVIIPNENPNGKVIYRSKLL